MADIRRRRHLRVWPIPNFMHITSAFVIAALEYFYDCLHVPYLKTLERKIAGPNQRKKQ
jgi:hypothetical protein